MHTCLAEPRLWYLTNLACPMWSRYLPHTQTLREVVELLLCAREQRRFLRPRFGSWVLGGFSLVFKAHRLLYHSTPGLRVIKKKKVRVWVKGVEVRILGYQGPDLVGAEM